VRESCPINNGIDEYVRGIQSAWVRLTGGDTGAKDLARVLRLPGTFNAKYDPPRKVEFSRFNLTAEGTELYELSDLCALAEPLFDAPAILPATDRPAPNTFAGANLTGIINTLNGAAEGERNSKLHWCACQLNREGLAVDAAIAELLPVALRVGLPERESLATIKSGYKQPIREKPAYTSAPHSDSLADRRASIAKAINGN
jgi:hypothetical protein